jgi:hypothetical protein
MPRPSKKSAQAKQQLKQAENKFNQIQYSSDSSSVYTDSQDDLDWCCMYRVLSLQEDFATEKPMLQRYIESRGHVCMFLPKFHCELNPIEMLWGFAKYCESPIFFLIFI